MIYKVALRPFMDALRHLSFNRMPFGHWWITAINYDHWWFWWLTATKCNVFISKPCGQWWFRTTPWGYWCFTAISCAHLWLPEYGHQHLRRVFMYSKCLATTHDSKSCPAADCAMHSNRWWYGTYVLHTVWSCDLQQGLAAIHNLTIWLSVHSGIASRLFSRV